MSRLTDVSKEELELELKRRETDKKVKHNETKAELLILLGKHFLENKEKNFVSSSFRIIESSGGAEQGSHIDIRIRHYGMENYYGKEIAELYENIMKVGKYNES